MATPATPAQRVLLVADPDPGFLSSLKPDANTEALPRQPTVRVFIGGREAQLSLADPNERFAALFINPAVRGPSGISVVRAAHQHRPGTPIFLIVDQNTVFTADDLKGLGVQRVLKKPLTLAALKDAAFPTVSFDAGETIAASRGVKADAPDALDTEFSEDDGHFLAIRAENFLSGSRCLFDVYIRLGSKRFLKILHAGDSFAPARITGYIKNGATHLYLRKDIQEHYLAYCDRIAAALAGAEAAPGKVALRQSMHQGEETLKFLRERGLSEDNLKYASKYVANVRKLTERLAPSAPQVLRDFLADLRGADHGAATTVIASLLAKQLGIETEGGVDITGLAAMLHDVGLMRMPAEVQTEDTEKMPHHMRDLYRTHPGKSADVLRDIPKINPTVIQAVLQHHERRNQRGFPAKTPVGGINVISEIVGLSDEFSRLIELIPADRFQDIKTRLELDVFPGFSPKVVEAFRKVFLPSEPKSPPA